MNPALTPVFSDWPAWEEKVEVDAIYARSAELAQLGGELLSLWGSDERSQGSGFVLHLYLVVWNTGTFTLRCNLSLTYPCYPDLCPLFPVAARMQRALYDLLGFIALGAEDERPWLRHQAWPQDCFPLRNEVKLTDVFTSQQDEYAFVRVGGEGVHELPVGPVHAGIIESGHFHFNVVGEHLLRLEERLGYTHKGLAKHFQGATLSQGAKLAGRISGDSTVAYAWAYAMAIENAHQHRVPPRALWLRALLLERERIVNHLGDLGAIGKDAGLDFAMNQFSRLKENALRLNADLFDHRYAMDCIVPGGTAFDLTREEGELMLNEIPIIQAQTHELFAIFRDHSGLQDRFFSTGILSPERAGELGVLGLPARASHRPVDWRMHIGFEPYHQFSMNCPIAHEGDVAARVLLRFKEINESLQALAFLVQHLPTGEVFSELPPLQGSQTGFGCVEGWRGPVFFAACLQDANHLLWGHAHDPSWQNWPALAFAVMGNIVPDFPLINKSFNLSYSGHDS